jgi:uncharacterized protein YjbI with pentapeptide repeats
LSGANLSGLELFEIQVNDGDFSFADLSGANLSLSYLEGDFTGADLSNINGGGYIVFSGDFIGADLTNADLSGARIGVEGNSADLTNADLTNANLSGAVFGSITWNNTTCPDGTNSDDNGDTCENNL